MEFHQFSLSIRNPFSNFYYYRCIFDYLLDVFWEAEEIVKWAVKRTDSCSSVEQSGKSQVNFPTGKS